MKITKYEHACFTAIQDGQVLVVDPGVWTTDFDVPGSVAGIVITHEHLDHNDESKLAAITEKNPDAIIISHQEVIDKLGNFKTNIVAPGETFEVGPFSLEFFGGQHATIHSSYPTIANIGVMINGLLYYPGDSFSEPGKPVDVLALPASAPWLKISEVMDFLMSIKPRLAFPTHDAILSQTGQELVDKMLGGTAQTIGTTYQRIDKDQGLEL
jgi:L-ascorbate metabolism protein UlaG (beta-lactamase superfamily)